MSNNFAKTTAQVRTLTRAVGAELSIAQGIEIGTLRQGPCSIRIVPSFESPNARIIYTVARGYEGLDDKEVRYRDGDLSQAVADVKTFFDTGKL